MTFFKTMVTFEGFDEGSFYLADTIFFLNSWWLVSTWLVDDKKGTKTPERLVRLTGLRFQEVEGDYRFLLNNAIPKSVFDGTPQEGFLIADFEVLCSLQDNDTSH